MAEAEAAEVREQMVHKSGVRLGSPVHSRGWGWKGRGGVIEYLLENEQSQICTWDNATLGCSQTTLGPR